MVLMYFVQQEEKVKAAKRQAAAEAEAKAAEAKAAEAKATEAKAAEAKAAEAKAAEAKAAEAKAATEQAEVTKWKRVSLRKKCANMGVFESLVQVMVCVCVFVCALVLLIFFLISQKGSIIKWKGYDSGNKPTEWTRVEVLFVNQKEKKV